MTLTDLIFQLIELANEHEAKLFTSRTDANDPEVVIVVEDVGDGGGEIYGPVTSVKLAFDGEKPTVQVRCD